MNGPGSRNIQGRFHRSHHHHRYGSSPQPPKRSFHCARSRKAPLSQRKVHSFNKNMYYNAYPTLLMVVMFLSLPSSVTTLMSPVVRIPSSSISPGRTIYSCGNAWSSSSNRILPCSNLGRATFPSKTAAAATITIATETSSTSLKSSGSFNEIDNFIMELTTYQNYKLALFLQTGVGTLVLSSIAILVYRNGWRDSSGKKNIWERRINQRRKFNGKRYDNYYFGQLVLMLRKSYAGGLLWLLTSYYTGYVSWGRPYPKQGPIASDLTNPTDVNSIDSGSPSELSQQLQQLESDTDGRMSGFDEEIDDGEEEKKEELVPIENETESDIGTMEEFVTTSSDSTIEAVTTLTLDTTTSSITPPLLEAAAAAMVLPAPLIDGANNDPLLPIVMERMEKEKNRPILPPLSSVSLPSIKIETNQTARILTEVKELAATLEKVQETMANEKVEKARIFTEVLELANSFEKIRETIDLNSDLYKERLSAYEETIRSLEEAVVNRPYYLTELNNSAIDNLESDVTEEDWLMEEDIIDRQGQIEVTNNEDIDIAESTITMKNEDIDIAESTTAATIVDNNNAVNEPSEPSIVEDDETPSTTPLITTTANEDMNVVDSTPNATTPIVDDNNSLSELCEPSTVEDGETSSTTPLITTTANENMNVTDCSKTAAAAASIVANSKALSEPSESSILEDDELTSTTPLTTTTVSEDIDVADSIAATTTIATTTMFGNNTENEPSEPSIVEDDELPSIPALTTTAANEDIDVIESTTIATKIVGDKNATSELSEPFIVEDDEPASTTLLTTTTANEDIDVAGSSSTAPSTTTIVGDNSAVGEYSEPSIVEEDEPPSTTPPKKSLMIVPEYEVARRLFDVAFQDEKQRQEAYIQKGRDPVAELRRDRQLDAEILHNARKKEVDYIVRHGGSIKGKLPPLRKRVGQGADSVFVEGTEDRQVDGSQSETQERRRGLVSGSLPPLRKRGAGTVEGIDSRRMGGAIKKAETSEGERWLVNAQRERQLHRERTGKGVSNDSKKGGFYRSAELGTGNSFRRFGKQNVVDTSTTAKRSTAKKTGRGVLLGIKRQKKEEEVIRSKRYGLGHIIAPASSSSVEVVSAATDDDNTVSVSSQRDGLQPTTTMRMRNGTRTGTGTGTGWNDFSIPSWLAAADRKRQLNAFAITKGTSSMESVSSVFSGVEKREGASQKLWNILGRRKVWILALTIAIGREALPLLLTKKIL